MSMVQTDIEDPEYLGKATQPRDKITKLRAGALAAALSKVSGALGREKSLPILTCVLLRTSNGKMTIEACNMELAIRHEVATEGNDESAGCVNAALLGAVAGRLAHERKRRQRFGNSPVGEAI